MASSSSSQWRSVGIKTRWATINERRQAGRKETDRQGFLYMCVQVEMRAEGITQHALSIKENKTETCILKVAPGYSLLTNNTGAKK